MGRSENSRTLKTGVREHETLAPRRAGTATTGRREASGTRLGIKVPVPEILRLRAQKHLDLWNPIAGHKCLQTFVH